MINHETEIKRRQSAIIKTSFVGIAGNLLLTLIKLPVGLLTNSIAILLDAVNSLSDVLSSTVVIVGIRLANKAPDRNHPMGHGRYEYLSTAIIAVIIMYIGVTALSESVSKIINPEVPSYNLTSILLLVLAVIIKIFIGIYYRKRAKVVDSDSLRASGIDALFDSVVSFATLVAAIIYLVSGIAIESYLAAIISLLIVRSGFKMLYEVFSVILGERIDSELSKNIKKSISQVSGVRGVYDLIIHDYGTNMMFCSVNIEVSEDLTAREVDDISREVRRKVFYGYHIFINSVGIYSVNTDNAEANKIYRRIRDIMSMYEYVMQIHGFHYDGVKKEISFDVVISFDVKNRRAYYLTIKRHLRKVFPQYHINLALDSDYSD